MVRVEKKKYRSGKSVRDTGSRLDWRERKSKKKKKKTDLKREKEKEFRGSTAITRPSLPLF